MIKRYTDHSANERTYLAWVRTSIAVMAFGFLIEKFELFMSSIGHKMVNDEHFKSSLSAELVGLGLFLLGALIIITATVRFFVYKKAIEDEAIVQYKVKTTNLLLSVLMILLAVFLFFYMLYQVVT